MVGYELLDAREWAISRAGEIGSDLRGRDVDADFEVEDGIEMVGLTFVEVEAVDAMERVSWSALTEAESDSPYSSLRCRQSHSVE